MSSSFPVDSQLNAKIADLDLGQQMVYKRGSSITSRDSIKSDASQHEGPSSSMLGKGNFGMNITWQAPEVLLGQGYTQKSDIHSLALVLWEIIASGRTIKKYSSKSDEGGGSRFSSSNSHGMNIDITTTSIPISSVPYSDCKSQLEIREKVASSSLFIAPLSFPCVMA
jgi:hypothetical protein